MKSLMSSQKVKAEVRRTYKSAQHNTERIVNSSEAHKIGTKAKETMINAKDGARRIMDSQEVRGKGNEIMDGTKEFLGAVYKAAHKENAKKLTPKA